MFPQRFRERYEQIVDDSDAFFSCLQTFAPKSFRVNTIKAWPEKVRVRLESYGFGIKSVPWCDHAFTSDSLEIGSTLEHFLGHIYMQELASMLPPLIVREELAAANTVLDGCAAPGSTAQTRPPGPPTGARHGAAIAAAGSRCRRGVPPLLQVTIPRFPALRRSAAWLATAPPGAASTPAGPRPLPSPATTSVKYRLPL